MITPSPRPEEIAKSAAAAATELLSDHLSAALDHCDAIEAAQIQLGASVSGGSTGRAILRQGRSVTHFVADLRARELSIALRLTQASVVAQRAASLSGAIKPVSALITSGAGVLIDAGMRIASEAQDGSPFAYLVSRGLVAAGETSLPDDIASSDSFIVLGVMPLAELRRFLEAALRAIEDSIGH